LLSVEMRKVHRVVASTIYSRWRGRSSSRSRLIQAVSVTSELTIIITVDRPLASKETLPKRAVSRGNVARPCGGEKCEKSTV
jgi:hypothetical protein